MGCDELLDLLNTRWAVVEEPSEATAASIAAHIRSCPSCHRRVVQLSETLVAKDVLTCNQCRTRFAAYYEATHPDHPLFTMPAIELVSVAIHLAHCVNCREEYKALVLLWQLEEKQQSAD
ncbi:MAG: hypothetical protein JO123_09290 [Ktedonobacteraceae bacterium]|nr:hypothetical protein [Ktedonobacteraceae bacterium]